MICVYTDPVYTHDLGYVYMLRPIEGMVNYREFLQITVI